MMRSNQLSYAPGVTGIIADVTFFRKAVFLGSPFPVEEEAGVRAYGGGRKFHGFTLPTPCMISKCRCEPEDLPVEPMPPMVCC